MIFQTEFMFSVPPLISQHILHALHAPEKSEAKLFKMTRNAPKTSLIVRKFFSLSDVTVIGCGFCRIRIFKIITIKIEYEK